MPDNINSLLGILAPNLAGSNSGNLLGSQLLPGVPRTTIMSSANKQDSGKFFPLLGRANTASAGNSGATTPATSQILTQFGGNLFTSNSNLHQGTTRTVIDSNGNIFSLPIGTADVLGLSRTSSSLGSMSPMSFLQPPSRQFPSFTSNSIASNQQAIVPVGVSGQPAAISGAEEDLAGGVAEPTEIANNSVIDSSGIGQQAFIPSNLGKFSPTALSKYNNIFQFAFRF